MIRLGSARQASIEQNNVIPFPAQPQEINSANIVSQEAYAISEVSVAKETDLPSFQELIERIDSYSRFPLNVTSDEITLFPNQLNEALQRQPCVLLEHYLTRIIQLRKMVIQAQQLPHSDRLVFAVNQHLVRTEYAAKTLSLKSTTPVQDSLWPLYERILNLPTLEPDLFGAAVAILHEKLPYSDSSNPLTYRVKELLSNLKPAAHHLWAQIAPFTDGRNQIEETKNEILVLQHLLTQAPEGNVKVFLEPIKCIFKVYRDFLERFDRLSDEKKQEMSVPKVQLSGPGLGFFLMDQSVARTLISRDEQGKLCRKNEHGTHAVHCEAGIFYKPNSDNMATYIHPEMEFAVYALYQRLGREGVAPTALLKISHLFSDEQPEPHGRTVQAGYGIEGLPLQDLLDIANVLPFLTDCLGVKDAQQVFQWLMRENWQQEVLSERPHLSLQALSSLTAEESAKCLVDAFENMFQERAERKRCLEFYDRASPEATEEQFRGHILKGSTSLLLGCLALLMQHADLAVISTKERLRQVSYEELIKLQLSMNTIKALFPNYSADQLLKELPQLMERFDSADFSTHFIATLLTNPRDYRVDNLMVTLCKNDQGEIESFSLVGIDNDLAFAPEESVRTMLFLFPLMNKVFDRSVAQHYLKMTPEELILDWLIALEEQNQSYERWQKRGVVIQDGVPDGNSPSLDIPLKIDRLLIPKLYEKAKLLQEKLMDSSCTHWDLLLHIQPQLAKVYQKASKSNSNSVMAYGELESLFRQESLGPPIEESPVCFSTATAALQFLKSFDLGNFPVRQQASLIGKALHTFPSSASSLSLPGDPADPRSRREFFLAAVTQGHCALVACLLEEERKSRLRMEDKPLSLMDARNDAEQTPFLIACFRHDLEMIRLLVHYGADTQVVDIEKQGALALCLIRFPNAPTQAAAAIRLLGDQCVVSWNSCSSRFGYAPLHSLVERAEKAPEEAEALIAYLIEKGANPDLVDNHERTPLDYAIRMQQERFVEQLIRLGAGRTLNVEAAVAFFESHPHLNSTFDLLKSHSLLLRWHLALIALKRVCASSTTGSLEGAQLGKIHLSSGVTKRLLDAEGDIMPEILNGRRSVNKITISGGHELYFKQYPEMPGVEYAIDTLFKLLIGHGTSFTDFARLTTAKGVSYPVLISQGIRGENLHDVLTDPAKVKQLNEKLDPLAYSELLLTSLLVNFEDAKPDNFIVEPLPGGSCRLVGIDNDHAFVPPLLKEGSDTVQVKCILYCLEQMKQPLHPCARERFLSFSPERILRLWLNQLQEHNGLYCDLFNEAERKELFTGNTKNLGMVIPIPFKPGAIVDIYQKFRRLQIALQESPNLTGLEVLRLVIPSLGIRYEEAFHAYRTPLERFHSLTKTQYSAAIAGRYQTLVGSRLLLKSMDIPEKNVWNEMAEQGPRPAIKELDRLENEMLATGAQLRYIRNELQKGNVEHFNDLQLDTSKEKVINGIPGIFEGIDFQPMQVRGTPDQERQKRVLSAILKGNYRSLRLLGCAVFDKTAFELLIRFSPQLLSLELQGFSKLDQNLLKQLSNLRYLTHLRLIDLPRSVEQISLPHPNLRQLEITSCQGLQKLTVSHTLKDLFVDSCWKLSSIESKLYEQSWFLGPKLSKEAPKDSVLQRLRLKACPRLQPWWEMFKDWLKISSTNEIQLQNVPPSPNNAQVGFVVEAVLASPQAQQMMPSLRNFYQDEKIGRFISSITNDPTELNLGEYAGELTDSWLRVLSLTCPNLRELNLSGCKQVSDAGLVALSKGCPNLTSIDLNDCKQISDLGMIALSSGCPFLTNVSLWKCNLVTDVGLNALSSCSGLSRVNFSWCTQISDVGLMTLSSNCPGLTFVELTGCTKISDLGVMALASACKGLDEIYLALCTNITDSSLKALSSGCLKLTKVHLRACIRVSDEGVKALAATCRLLTEVWLGFCPQISDAGVKALSFGCLELTKIELVGCLRVNSSAIDTLKKQHPNIVVSLASDISILKNEVKVLTDSIG